MYCPHCGLRQPTGHRYCMSCGSRFPSEGLTIRRPKATRFFRSLPVHPDDDASGFLKVSRYLEEFIMESGGGSVTVPSHHVRFSVWAGDRCMCAASISDDEVEALIEFLQAEVANGANESQDEPASR